MSTHVIKSTVAPTVAPTLQQLGVHWVKTTDPVGHWLAVDTSVDGWLDLINLTSGGGGSAFIGGTGGKVSVPGNTFTNSTVTIGMYNVSATPYSGGTYPEAFLVPVYGDMSLTMIQLSRAAAVGGETTTARAAVYSSDPVTGLPAAIVAEGSRTSTGTTDLNITLSTPVELTAGQYWVCIWLSESRTLSSLAAEEATHYGSYNSLSFNNAITVSDPFPASIDPVVIAAPYDNSNCPIIGLVGA